MRIELQNIFVLEYSVLRSYFAGEGGGGGVVDGADMYNDESRGSER